MGEVGAEKGGLSGAPTQPSGAPGWARRQEPSGLEGVSRGEQVAPLRPARSWCLAGSRAHA